jgi:hypothetical protein
MKRLYWKAICRVDRIKAISILSDIVSRYGTLLDFKKFSDLEMSMLVEVEPSRVRALHEDLSGVMNLEGDRPEDPDAAPDLLVFVHISFPRGKGDLALAVPDVPG